MTNTSGITPVGLSVLVEPEQIEEKTESGIVIGTPEQVDRLQMAQTDGIVLALGPRAFYDEDVPRCNVGDKIIMKAYAGMIKKGLDGKQYRIIADTEIIGILGE